MKNLLKLTAWLCGAIAMVMMLLGVIAVFMDGIFLNHRWDNYFYPAYNFLLLGIFLFMATLVKKDN